MKSFSDEEILEKLEYHKKNASDMPKEGGDTNRGVGLCGRAGNEYLMWRCEALKRGLVRNKYINNLPQKPNREYVKSILEKYEDDAENDLYKIVKGYYDVD